MFTEQEIKMANATSRSSGASALNKDGSIRAIVPKYVREHMDRADEILDFGAGKDAVHTKWLRSEGFNVVAYDFGDNCIDGIHDRNALNKQYKVIMASNVINVCSSLNMLITTLRQMYDSLKPGGCLVINYPASPRKTVLNAMEVSMILYNIFHGVIQMVGGTKSAPLWLVVKPNEEIHIL